MTKRKCPLEGTGVIWPAGLQRRYGISAVTRWRWEKDGKLPPRDLFVGNKSGWRPSTIDAAEQGPAAGGAA